MYLFCLVVLQTLLQLLKQLPILLVRFFIYSEPPINAPDAYPKNVVHKLHGLIIGIDRYRDPKLPVLSGAVNDANSIRQFLIDDLGTSPSHITYLLDTQATREGIIQAIQALRKNPKIRHGDPILIYFAGHGGANDAREEWRARHKGAGKIQFIFPYDFGEDCNGKEVIPDKTIACLLNELAAAKGNNITVIFDSCHSASGSRSSEMGGDGRHARSADLRPEIPLDIDCDIIGRSPATTATSASRHTESPFCTNQNSHIHLAACGSNEYAWEKDGRGEFTAALLKAMRERGVNRVTYHNLIQVLPDLAQQTPHCYGAHKNRTVFNGHVPPQEVAYIPVTFDPDTKNTVLTLHAGYSSGVAEGSVWELRTSPTSGNEDIVGTATANSSGASETKLIWGEEDNPFREYCGSKLYARLLKSGSGSELKVWVSPEAKKLISPELQGGSQETTSMEAPEFNYVLCPDQDGADMIVEIYTPTGQSCEPTIGPVVEPNVGPKIQFRLCHPTVQKYGVATLRRHTSACGADVEKILFAAAKWHWYLNQTNPKCLQNPVKMDIFKIAERMKDHGGYSDTLREQVPRERWINLNNDQVNEVEFYPHKRDLYGVRLSSKLDRPLYVRMFYFDTTTFCILNQFGHTGASGREDPDFNPPGEFIIGDDGDGGTPLPFSLDPGEALDVGFLKAFWSTDPLELGNVNQDSAFEMRSGRHGGTVGKLARETDWGTTTLVLVQRSPIGEDES